MVRRTPKENKERQQIAENFKSIEEDILENLKEQPKWLRKILGHKQDLESISENLTKTGRLRYKQETDTAKEIEKQLKHKQKAKEIIEDQLEGLKDTYDSWVDIKDKIVSLYKGGGALALTAVAVLYIGKKVLELRDTWIQLREEMGASIGETNKMIARAGALSFKYKILGVEMDEVLDTQKALVEEFGRMDVLTTSTVDRLTLMSKTIGLATDEGAKLLKVMETVSGLTTEAALDSISFVAELARAEGVAPAAVMSDVAGATEMFALWAKDGGKNLYKAAIAARKLGVELSTVESIAEHLLDFETSINAQMEAQMFLGRSLNFDRARMLAMQGNFNGMLNEVIGQMGDINDLANLDYFQRKKLAEALGISAKELGSIVANQQRLNEMNPMLKHTLGFWEKISKTMPSIVIGLKAAAITMSVLLLPILAKVAWGYIKAGFAALGFGAQAAAALAAATMGLSLLVGGLAAAIAYFGTATDEATALGKDFGSSFEEGLDTSGMIAHSPSPIGLKIAEGITTAVTAPMVGDEIVEGITSAIPTSVELVGAVRPTPAVAAPVGRNEIVEKLNEVVALLKESGDVFLDGKKVGTALAVKRVGEGVA